MAGVMPPPTTGGVVPVRSRRRMPAWLRVFLVGLVLWLVTVPVTFITGNVNLIPTVVLLGSFLVPVTFVVYAFGRADDVVTPQRIFIAFVCGGVLGVLGASILEAELLRRPSGPSYIGVGLIEEAAKLAALWLLTRRLPRYTARDGIVFGAAVGLGFAALESAGYAFTSLFTASGGLSLLNVVETEVLRGILTPFGHGLWTAILGGALFATAARSRDGRPRMSGAVFGWYLVVALLHAFWDSAQTIAAWLTLVLTGSLQIHTYTIISWMLLGLDAVVGLAILWRRWRRAVATPSHSVTVAPAMVDGRVNGRT